MKVFFSIILSIIFSQNCFFCSINDSKKNIILYDGDAYHIFIHSLIAYPEILEKKDEYTINLYKKDCIDYKQFEKLLLKLYEQNYVLIDINSTFIENENGKITKQKVKVPLGKKPLVISVDDVVYDPKKSGNGMVDKLVLKGEKIVSQTLIDGKIVESDNREFLPILENFLAKYPDFSYNNARFTINLTGFCGILGYRISSLNKEVRENELKNVAPLIKKMKNLGYNFASHSFSHYHMKSIPFSKFEKDLQDWKTFIEPAIGKTSIYCYPYGEYEIEDNNSISSKQNLLKKYGFKLFLGVGPNNFFGYVPFNRNINEKILLWDRKNICKEFYKL